MAMIKRVTRKALKKFLKLLHWLDSDKIKFFHRLKIELETCIMLARVRKENEMSSIQKRMKENLVGLKLWTRIFFVVVVVEIVWKSSWFNTPLTSI